MRPPARKFVATGVLDRLIGAGVIGDPGSTAADGRRGFPVPTHPLGDPFVLRSVVEQALRNVTYTWPGDDRVHRHPDGGPDDLSQRHYDATCPMCRPDLNDGYRRLADEVVAAITQARSTERVPSCSCARCDPGHAFGGTLIASRMSVCPVCGNKRCPKGADHDNTCTGSNARGQKGSRYA